MNTVISALGDFKVFAAAKDILEKSIGRSILHDVVIFNEERYSFNDWELQWYDAEEEYSEEARLMKSFNDCEMYIVHSCTGEEYIAVFDKSNKVEG